MSDMKRVIPGTAHLAMFLLVLSCGRQNGSEVQGNQMFEESGQDIQGEPVIQFDTLIHDFGTIIEGERVFCYFDYINSGGGDLLITAVEATCGCTTPDWSNAPLGPGERETLEIIFDASGRSGEQRKLVTVKSNASNKVVQLTIRANVNINN